MALFSRVKSTEQADEITTVIFSVQNLKQERKSNDVSEQDLFDHMLSSKKLSEDNELKQRRLAETIRNLEMLDWVKLRFSESLPVSSYCQSHRDERQDGCSPGPRGPQMREVMRSCSRPDVQVVAREAGFETSPATTRMPPRSG